MVLKIRRTLSAEQIDDIIAGTVARFELAAEQARRREWQLTAVTQNFRSYQNKVEAASVDDLFHDGL
ncbi:MAG TPA: hypothetical protein VE567_08585, partial [Sphingomonas sp.]|nr:hypothetical protein [Sphingomonas sp.]